jgi:anti-sigma B factor antagonist
MDLDLEATRERGASVITLRGDVDVYSAPLLRQKIVDLVDEGELNLVIDLAQVESVDSTGVGVLVDGMQRIKERGGRVDLVADRDRIGQILDLTGPLSDVRVHGSKEEALGQPSPEG